MIPILYGATEKNFTTTGIGRLSDAAYCNVKEVRNGEFELELRISTKTAHFKDIKLDRIIYAIHDDTKKPQPFRIYKISRPIGGIVSVYARHISYDLIKIVAMPYKAGSAADALSRLNTYAATGDGTTGFTFWTDIASTSGSFSLDVPTSVRSVLGGMNGSILDTWHGEYEWDRFTVKLHASRGNDNGVVISYGKNLTDVKKETDASNLWNRVVPYWSKEGAEGTAGTLVTLPEKYINAPNIDRFETIKVRVLDLSEEFSAEPTAAQLRSAAQRYASKNAKSEASTNLNVSFVALWQTEEYAQYASLQRLRLCDVVTVRHEDLGVDDKLEIIETNYNVLTERYDSMTLGEPRSRFGNTVEEAAASEAKSVSVSKSFMQAAVEKATETLRGGAGGHILISTDANGVPHEIFAMDTDDIQTAVKVIRINMNGIGFSKNGVNGPYETAWTIDGDFVADFITAGAINANLITAGTLNANIIRAGLLSDVAGNNWWNLVTGDLSLTGDVTMSNNGVLTRIGEIVFAQYNSTEGRWIDRTAYGLQIVPSTGQIHYSITPVGSRRRVSTRKGFDNSDYDDMVDFTASNDSSVRYVHTMRHGQVYEHKIRSASTPTDCARFRFGFENGNYFLQFSKDTSFAVNSSGFISFYRGDLYTNGTKVALDSTSSKRYKRDIEPMEAEELDPTRLYDLPVVQYRYKEGAPLQYADMAGQLLPGFIAEDVEDVYPAAAIHKDGEVESWDERRIIPGMLALIQDQRAMIEELEARVSLLEARLKINEEKEV